MQTNNNNNDTPAVIKGIFKPHPKGFGFINADDDVTVFVPPRVARGLFFGDVVSSTTTMDDIGRLTATSVTLLETPRRRLAATIVKTTNGLEAMPEWSPVPCIALKADSLSVKEDDRVVVEIIAGDKLVPWRADVVWNGGPLSAKNVESALSMAEMEIPGLSSQEMEELALTVVAEGQARLAEESFRKDLRATPFVTIDGENTKDIDDAIHVRRTSTGFTLEVAIADVAQFVLPDSALDKDARNRGTTVYFNQQTIPMLPRSLSNGACSLNPNEDRAAIVATMEISDSGEITKTTMSEALIRSHYRLTYDEVTAAFTEDAAYGSAPAWKETLEPMLAMYEVLLAARIARGATPIRDGDFEMELDENGKPLGMKHRPWHLAYGMVEECMLAANTGVAVWMDSQKLPGIYRNHTGPDLAVWEERRKFFASIGLDSEEIPTPQGLATLTASAELTAHQATVDNAVRGAMRPAQYRTDQTMHFSLAYDAYTHFTSPIRRYADLSVHRVIKNALRNQPNPSKEAMAEVAADCTAKDLRARVAVRSETKRLKQEFAVQWVGQTTELQITNGNGAGWFVKSAEWYIDGFAMHQGEQRKAWEWRDDLQSAVGTNGTVIPAGTTITGVLKEVDLKKWRVGFEVDYTPFNTPTQTESAPA